MAAKKNSGAEGPKRSIKRDTKPGPKTKYVRGTGGKTMTQVAAAERKAKMGPTKSSVKEAGKAAVLAASLMAGGGVGAAAKAVKGAQAASKAAKEAAKRARMDDKKRFLAETRKAEQVAAAKRRLNPPVMKKTAPAKTRKDGSK